METRAHYVVVGAVAIFVTLAIAAFVVWLAGSALNEESTQYQVVFEGPPRGLQRGAEVQFNGIRVGEVDELGFECQDQACSELEAVATIDIGSQIPIKTDTTAQLEPSGLTGLSYVQLYSGSTDAQRLAPGGRIQAMPTVFDEFVIGGQEILQNSNQALQRLSDLFNEENVATISKTFANIEVLTANLAEVSARVEGDEAMMDEAFSTLSKFQDAADAVTEAGTEAAELARVFNTFIENEATKAAVDVSDAAIIFYEASDYGVDTVLQTQNLISQLQGETLTELGLAVEDLRGLADSAERIAREIENDPAAFLAGENRREVSIGGP